MGFLQNKKWRVTKLWGGHVEHNEGWGRWGDAGWAACIIRAFDSIRCQLIIEGYERRLATPCYLARDYSAGGESCQGKALLCLFSTLF
jgi:hypothetical protein